MKPVAFIVEASSLSGGVRVIFDYATRLKKRGHSVHVWSLGERPNWYDMGDVHWAQFPSYDAMVGFMKKDGKGFNKVATWWRTAQVLSLDTGSRDRNESLYLIQDLEVSYYFRVFERQAVAATYEYGFRHFTCNPWVASVLPMPCVGQAFDPQMFHRMKYTYPSDRVALAILRRQSLKGFSQLGELSRRLGALDPKAELWTLGTDAGVRLSGSHTAHFSNLPDNEVCKKYNEATVFVSTSLHEGFCLPLLECMSCGTPTVCFKAEGNEVFCKNDVNCLMFEKGDVKSFTEGVVAIMHDKKLAKRLVDAGLETARRYDRWSECVDQLEVVLSS